MSLIEVHKQTQRALRAFVMHHNEINKISSSDYRERMSGVDYAIYSELKKAVERTEGIEVALRKNEINKSFTTIPTSEYLKNKNARDSFLEKNPEINMSHFSLPRDLFINPLTGDIFKKHGQVRV